MNTLAALCAVGAERVLGNEIKQLGFTLERNAPGRVYFSGNDDALFLSNLCLRTADRVYLRLSSFEADSFDALFDGVYAIRWDDFFCKDVRVTVDKVRTHQSVLASERAVQAVVHKAIYRKLGDVWNIGRLSESGAAFDVRVYLERNTAEILLDLSGAPLYRRGYRTEGGPAPIRETTAAVLLQLMCWRRRLPLHDPFCGSGTIACEAALFAYNVAPGFGRRFAVEDTACISPLRAAELRKREAEKIKVDCEARITGTDIDADAVKRARANAERACVTAGRALQLIGSDARVCRPDFEQADFTELAAPYAAGCIISNPPYGERLGDGQQARALYADMADLFQSFAGWHMGFITSRSDFERSIGMTPSAVRSLKSGNLDTRFYIFKGAEA